MAATEMLMAALILGPGFVEAQDGRRNEGRLQLGNNVIHVQSSNGALTTLAWAQIRRARFTNAPAPEKPVGTPGGGLPSGWRSQDIGPVHRSGRASCDAQGMFTIRASGWGAWGPEDSIHYVFRSFSGDGQIIARLAHVDESHGKMAVSVMIRECLAPDAPMAGATLHPNGEVRLSRRVPREAPDFARSEDVAPYRWMRLTRCGQAFTAYRSTDGRFWEQVESRTVEMKADALVGLAAWTLSNTSAGELQMDSVQIIPGTPDHTWFAESDGLREGVVLRDGSAIAGRLQSFDTNGATLLRAGQSVLVPGERVARLVFHPPPADLTGLSRSEGLLLTSGAFVEGTITQIARQREDHSRLDRLRVTVSSVLFGLKTFDAACEVILANLAEVRPSLAAFQVRTTDGSLLRVQAIAIQPNGVVVDGFLRKDLIEITRLDHSH